MRIYNFKYLKDGLCRGVVAGIVALLLAPAFSLKSLTGTITALYGAIAPGILAATFGGTQTQESGPSGPMTVVSATFTGIAINISGSVIHDCCLFPDQMMLFWTLCF